LAGFGAFLASFLDYFFLSADLTVLAAFLGPVDVAALTTLAIIFFFSSSFFLFYFSKAVIKAFPSVAVTSIVFWRLIFFLSGSAADDTGFF